MGANHGGQEGMSPLETRVGDANANCPPDYVMLHDTKHQNTPFHAKKNFPGKGLDPSPYPSAVAIGYPLPILDPSPQPSLVDPPPASHRISARSTHVEADCGARCCGY